MDVDLTAKEPAIGDILKLKSISHCGSQLHMSYCFSSGLSFTTTLWYPFQLEELDSKYGISFMEEVYFHCALFEMNKLCTLAPSLKYIDLGTYSTFLTKGLEELWRILSAKAFGEWRFLHNLPNWKGPKFCMTEQSSTTSESKNPAISIEGGPVQCLVFCGGGKDSLASMKLLEEIGEPFHSLSYALSIYGSAQLQHSLTDSLVKHTASKKHHRVTLIDTFSSSPLPSVIPNAEVKSVICAETPSTIFEGLPFALMYGYTQFCLAHERSANKGNLVWDVNSEEINHQWVKSYNGEILITSYIKENLISNLAYFSSLMPIHDPLIFYSIAPYTAAIPFTHSCNQRKPWCLRCPKCCYVWLGYSAYFSEATVHATFGDENLLDVEENQLFFTQMLGLGEQIPFECIGQVDEIRMAFQFCHLKGIKGKAMAVFEAKVAAQFDAQKLDIASKFGKVYTHDICIPESLAERLLLKLGEISERFQDKMLKLL